MLSSISTTRKRNPGRTAEASAAAAAGARPGHPGPDGRAIHWDDADRGSHGPQAAVRGSLGFRHHNSRIRASCVHRNPGVSLSIPGNGTISSCGEARIRRRVHVAVVHAHSEHIARVSGSRRSRRCWWGRRASWRSPRCGAFRALGLGITIRLVTKTRAASSSGDSADCCVRGSRLSWTAKGSRFPHPRPGTQSASPQARRSSPPSEDLAGPHRG